MRGHGGKERMSAEGMSEGEYQESYADGPDDSDDEIRQIFVSIIGFVANARASDAKKNQALDDIQKLQARLLP